MIASKSNNITELEFSNKYDLQHAHKYAAKHSDGFFRKLSNWREQFIARKALQTSGNPQSILDLPCGTGRFWNTLVEHPTRKIYAADYSNDMIKVAKHTRPPKIVSRVQCFQSSAFDIKMDDESVQNIFCMRLLHHIGDETKRAMMLKEFHRVTSDTVCISLWVDGNRQADRRLQLENKRKLNGNSSKYQNRFVIPRAIIEQEFEQFGFEKIAHYDLIKNFSMWRIYVLRKCKVFK